MVRRPRVPSYRLHRPSGQAVVTLSGHDYYLGQHGSEESHQEYERLIAEWLASGRVGPAVRAPDLTVAELLHRYWAYAQTYYRDVDGRATAHLATARCAIRTCREMYGPTPAREFGPQRLAAVREAWVRSGLIRNTCNSYTMALRRAWRWAAGMEMVPASCAEALGTLAHLSAGRTTAPDNEPVQPAPEDAVEAVRIVLPVVIRDMIDLQLATGARPGEVVGLRGDQIDRSGPVWYSELQRHKTRHHRKRRVLLFGPRAQAILTPRLLRYGSDWLFPPVEAAEERRRRYWQGRIAEDAPLPPVPPRRGRQPRKTPRKGHYRESSYCRAIAVACEQAGCPHWHPHQLRHNAATRLEEEFGIEIAQQILGHASLRMTSRYVHSHLARAAAAILQSG